VLKASLNVTYFLSVTIRTLVTVALVGRQRVRIKIVKTGKIGAQIKLKRPIAAITHRKRPSAIHSVNLVQNTAGLLTALENQLGIITSK
jgi:hypothetical protein